MAGVALGKVESLLTAGDEVVKGDAIFFQEVQRGQPGWARTVEFGEYIFVKYQGQVSWRGVAIAVKKNKFAILKKKACEHGMWLQVEDRLSGQRVWLGSLYLSTGVPVEYQVQYRRLLEQLPPTAEAVMLGGDMNIALGWTQNEDGDSVSMGSSTKLRGLKTACAARRLELLPQKDTLLRTHISRKDENIGGQIDGMWSTRPRRCSEVRVGKDSRKIIGSDHEVITCQYQLEPEIRRRQQKRGGIRVLKQEMFDIPEVLDQASLEKLAKRVTGPPKKDDVRLPPEIVQLRREARSTRQAEQWKRYMAALRKHRVAVQSKKLEEAAADWQTYRKVQREGKTSWAHDFAAGLDEEPLQHIKQHFQGKFASGLEGLDGDLSEMRAALLRDNPNTQFARFQEKEVKQAVDNGKCRKSVGADMVPQELLRAVANTEAGLKGLTHFFNDLLCQHSMPESWHTSILTLLSKVEVPHQASQLRLVVLTSHVYKTFSRLVLHRISSSLTPLGPEQTSCPGRQAADFVWSLQNICQLSLEWGSGLAMAKLVVARAFDSLDRRMLARALVKELGAEFPWEVGVVIRMLQADTLSPRCGGRRPAGLDRE